jgi:hypothetical protein
MLSRKVALQVSETGTHLEAFSCAAAGISLQIAPDKLI